MIAYAKEGALLRLPRRIVFLAVRRLVIRVAVISPQLYGKIEEQAVVVISLAIIGRVRVEFRMHIHFDHCAPGALVVLDYIVRRDGHVVVRQEIGPGAGVVVAARRRNGHVRVEHIPLRQQVVKHPVLLRPAKLFQGCAARVLQLLKGHRVVIRRRVCVIVIPHRLRPGQRDVRLDLAVCFIIRQAHRLGVPVHRIHRHKVFIRVVFTRIYLRTVQLDIVIGIVLEGDTVARRDGILHQRLEDGRIAPDRRMDIHIHLRRPPVGGIRRVLRFYLVDTFRFEGIRHIGHRVDRTL